MPAAADTRTFTHSPHTGPWAPITLAALACVTIITLAQLFPSVILTPEAVAAARLSPLPVGTLAPDFELHTALNRPLRLSDTPRPTLLVFYLGDTCPHCVRQLLALKDASPLLAAHHITTLAISADAPTENLMANLRFNRFPFELLSDPDRAVATRYGIYDPTTNHLLNALFLIDSSNHITWSNTNAVAMENLTPLLHAIDPNTHR